MHATYGTPVVKTGILTGNLAGLHVPDPSGKSCILKCMLYLAAVVSVSKLYD